MSIPIFSELAQAQASILRRVPFDAMVVPPALREGIAARFGEALTPAQAVDRVIADVRGRGDAALHEWTQRLDGVTLEQLEVPHEQLAAAAAALDPDVLAALRLAAQELERFHLRQSRNSWADHSVEGMLGQLVVPLRRVGIYVPGGAAPLPSSLLHAAIPAKVAGVEELMVCTPPQRGTVGHLPAQIVLAAAHVAGVARLFMLGGAQAIAALAYGTASVPQVDKIVGPGNLFVVLAKRAVYGVVGIESLPGPTETLVIADANAHPRYVAADLLAQAEHVLASAILLTPSLELAQAVQAEVQQQLAHLPAENAQAAAEAMEQRGGIVLVPDLATAFEVANDYGPEHLCLLVEEPWQYIGRVRNAGGIFLGERSFEVLGDYVAGPSHIMPTGGTARYASPVNVDDFRKVISLVGLNEHALARIGPAAARLAEAEGLHAHAAAVRARLDG
ncbi:MAG: histidinol dehydrogenase [Chloroflexaceae bacterium]|nr:histidinol dehydrogenase [Chloroflexaceae bacterium]